MTELGLKCKGLSTLVLFSSNLKKCGAISPIFLTQSRFYKYEPKPLWTHSLPSSMNLTTQKTNCGCLTKSYTSLTNGSAPYTSLITVRHFVSSSNEDKPEPKPSLYQRFKAMYRDYWYVLLPVHLVTSAAWFGSFYWMASSGVDIVALLESLHVSDKVINPLRNGHSTTGYLAISYALYKIATPVRYTVTLGGTTLSISYLEKWGYIKPVPSKERLKEMYEDRKEMIKERGQSLKDNMIQTFKPTENN